MSPPPQEVLSRSTVSVSSPNVSDPQYVRYAWLPYPDPPPNLVNSVGLPASPFSTESEDKLFTQDVDASSAKTDNRPNILFIVSEDNSEHLGCYGERRVHTPHLDALAQGGVRYTRAYVPHSVCSPSRKYIHTFTTGSSPNLLYMQFGIRDEHYKLVYNPDRALNLLAKSRYSNSNLPEDQYVQSFLYPPEYELYDLQENPHEWTNLADSVEHQDIRKRLRKASQDFQYKIKDPFASQENVATFIAE